MLNLFCNTIGTEISGRCFVYRHARIYCDCFSLMSKWPLRVYCLGPILRVTGLTSWNSISRNVMPLNQILL